MIPRHAVRYLALVACAALLAACQDAPPVAPTAQTAVGSQGSQDQVAAWFRQASPAVLALRGTVFADHDEVANRLVFGVENAAAIPGVRNALAHLGIPSSAYEVQVTAPIRQVATLRDRMRPTQGGTEGTRYYQPLSSVDATVIATEAADPTYFRGGACPRGKKCRYSDASRAAYSSAVASERGYIAKTTGANNGSLTIAGVFTVTAQDNTATAAPVGTTVNKVGRTTGWTRGNVSRTCVNTNVSGSNIAQLCQTFVSAAVGGGDSGSPVYTGTGNVTLVGILWGGNGDGTQFVFSPLKSIKDELGSFVAH